MVCGGLSGIRLSDFEQRKRLRIGSLVYLIFCFYYSELGGITCNEFSASFGYGLCELQGFARIQGLDTIFGDPVREQVEVPSDRSTGVWGGILGLNLRPQVLSSSALAGCQQLRSDVAAGKHKPT
jgi:hypothetical protein